MTFTATYDPADDKLRLSASSRLDKELYLRVKSAGFGWAPKQGVFYAVWSPSREDLLMELCGEIGDEDTTLTDRAEQRAERFEGYRENRTSDAERAHAAVESICDGIPMGQPILVGHHSERHARKDAERIENGMRKAVKMWETANYWKSRADGAIRAAKYKELPAVRARRIKGIEADIRSYIASYTPHANLAIMQTRWNAGPDAQPEPHVWVGPKGRGGHWVPAASLPAIEKGAQRWLQHLNNRLEYERAMLAEAGGPVEDKFDIQVGGRVLVGGEWLIVLRLNKSAGKLSSVTTNARYVSVIGIENVKDYRAPQGDDAAKVKAATKQAPLCNYPGDGFRHMTKAEYEADVPKWSDFPKIGHVAKTETTGAHRVRQTRAKDGKGYMCAKDRVFLTDQKRTDPPAVKQSTPLPAREFDAPMPRAYVEPEPTKFDALKDQLKAGVQVVSAPQLFPTPADLAARMVEAAKVQPGDRILEPSAGTGNILRAVGDGPDKVAVEINATLVDGLIRLGCSGLHIHQGDFLEQNGNLGKFDVVLMNPPFADGADIRHIEHAITFLKPGGRLVAICANGPRQQATLKPLADTWEDLPADTFKESGTSVNTAMLTISL